MLAGIIFHLLIHCIYWQHQQHLTISCLWSCQVTLSFTYDCQIISIQGVWNCHVQLAYKTSLAVSIYWPWLACSWTGKNKVGIKNQSINGCVTFSKFVVLLFRFFFITVITSTKTNSDHVYIMVIWNVCFYILIKNSYSI